MTLTEYVVSGIVNVQRSGVLEPREWRLYARDAAEAKFLTRATWGARGFIPETDLTAREVAA